MGLLFSVGQPKNKRMKLSLKLVTAIRWENSVVATDGPSEFQMI